MGLMDASILALYFTEFVQSRDDIGKTDDRYRGDHDASWLTHYIAAWLDEGDAVLLARGDFSAYLRGVIQIAMNWHLNESLCDFAGSPGKKPFQRRVTSPMLDRFELDEAPAFNPRHFREVCRRRGIRPTNC